MYICVHSNIIISVSGLQAYLFKPHGAFGLLLVHLVLHCTDEAHAISIYTSFFEVLVLSRDMQYIYHNYRPLSSNLRVAYAKLLIQ